jgi:hypothetical protein
MRTIIIYGRLQDTEYILTTFKNQMKNHKKILVIAMRVTRRVPHVEQKLITLPDYFSSFPDFRGVRVARSLVFCVVFVLLCSFSFGHCIVCPSSIYGF